MGGCVFQHDAPQQSLPFLPHTPVDAQIYDAIMVVVSQKLGRKCTITSLEPGTCDV